MHSSVYEWVSKVVEEHDLTELTLSVLEVGSYNVNGSVRDLFGQDTYIGLDIQEGPHYSDRQGPAEKERKEIQT